MTTAVIQPEAIHKQSKNYTLVQWLAIQKDYTQGKGMLTDLCLKYDMNYDTVTTRSCREKWSGIRAKWRAREAAKLRNVGEEDEKPEPKAVDLSPTDDSVETMRRQIKMIDEAMFSATSARDMSDLARAKQILQEQIFIALHGMKPGTMKPSRQKQRGSNASPIPIPEPLPMVVDDNSQAA